MSKSLRALESEVGIQLIRRSTRGVVCTPAGRAFLAHAGAIRAELRKAEEELAEFAAPGGGTVSAGFAPTVVAVAPKQLHSSSTIILWCGFRIMEGTASALVPLVRDETLDFAVFQSTPAAISPGLKFQALYRDRMVIACRRGHSLRGARSLRELADARWLGFNAPGSGSWLERAFAAVGLAPPAALHHVRIVCFRG